MGKLTTMRFKTKRRVKNIDQVYGDLSSLESINKYKNQPIQEDQTGLGQHYCIECARFFQNEAVLAGHKRGKVHRRRLKLIKEGPYTQLEADAAAGTNLEVFANKKNEMVTAGQHVVYPTIALEKKKNHLKSEAKLNTKSIKQSVEERLAAKNDQIVVDSATNEQ